MSDVAVLAAVREELGALSLAGTPRWDLLAGGIGYTMLGALDGVEVGLATTGVGAEAVAQRARAALEALRPRAVLSLGFAGGLRPQLDVGSLVLCTRLHQEGRSEADTLPLEADAGLTAEVAQTLDARQLSLVHGDCITVNRVLTSPAEKRRLGETGDALVADMESYWVGVTARELGIPFVALRAVLDPLSWTLPDFVSRAQGQRASSWLRPALAYTVSRPSGAFQLLRLWLASRRASRALAQATRVILPALAKAIPARS